MRRATLLLMCLVIAAFPAVALGEEPPHLELVHGLRERGYHDLALEYLLKLQNRKEPPLPAELVAVLPLEIARGQAAAAVKIDDAAKRDELMKSVRADLKKFVTNPANAKHPLLGEAQFDLAKLTLDDARAKAGAYEQLPSSDKSKPAKLKAAVAIFDEANKYFTDGGKALEQAWKDIKEDPKDKKSVADKQKAFDNYLTSLYLQGFDLYEKGSLLEKDDLKASSDALKAAGLIFDGLASYRDKSPLGWQGLAWYGRCWEGSDDKKRDDAYAKVNAEKKPEALPGQRLIRYFKYATEFKNGGGKTARTASRQAMEKWLTDYAGVTNKDAAAVLATREGLHTRYMLGIIYFEELKELSANDRKSPLGQNLVDKAMAIFDVLEDGDSEYALPSKYLKFEVLRRSGRATAKAIKDLKTFDECLLRARMAVQDAADLADDIAKADDDKAKEEIRKQVRSHYEVVRDAMQRGLQLLPETVEDDDWEMAHQMLYSGYYRTGDYLRAAVLVDYMARSAKKPDTARKFAVEALNLYRGLAGQSKSAADNERLVATAEWLEKRYPEAAETDTARGILGFSLMQQGKSKDAAAMWEKVSPKSTSFAEFSYRAGVTNWSLHIQSTREKKQPIQTASPERAKAVELLERSITSFEAAAKLNELNKTPTEEDKAKAAADLKMAIKAKLVLADLYNYIGETDKMLALVKPLVDTTKAKKLPEDLPPGTEGQILGLGLRGHVAKKDTKSALELLDTLQKQSGEEGGIGGLAELLRDLGRQIKNQIDLLEQQGEGASEQLQQTRDNFREFLGHVEKNDKLPPDLRLWVGTSYVSLDDHQKALAVFGSFTDPGANAQPQVKQIYNQSQFLKVRSARLAAEGETDKAKRKKAFDDATRLLTEAMKIKANAGNPAYLAEEALLLQGQELYSGPTGAISKWDRLQKGLEGLVDRGPLFKNTYNEALYNRVVCLYLEAKALKDKPTQQQGIQNAAKALNPIKRNNWGGPEYQPRYEAFLNNPKHKDLKDAFEKLQKQVQ